MSGVPRPTPRPEGLDEAFYEHCAAGRLCFQRCSACDTWRHLPRYLCAHCGSGDWEWREASGRGRVFTWTVTHRALHPAFADDVPYAVVVAELDEGVRLVARMPDVPPQSLEIDLPLRVELEPAGDGVALPVFRPLDQGST